MVKINNNDLVDYVDGTLDAARLAAVEAHLRTNAEDAELVSTMKMAQEALGEWDEVEPVKVSDDFWIKVREQLPEQPQRSWFRGALAQLGAWAWPAQSPLRLSMRVAAIAAIIALGAIFFAPQQDIHRGETNQPRLTQDEKTFIQQSLDRHSAYVSSQPLSGPSLIVPGDVRSAEHGADDAGHDQTPE
ncbi:MAG: zf-HC2 domain-containing protein [Abitibacteriaceae bacterium]|nr:zf-HC2 domain-containing protein [Abditibacteriaceae bacterium]